MITSNSTIRDIKNMKEFAGFGNLLFPMPDRHRDPLTLDQMERLLPYHSHIHTKTTIEVLETLKEEVGQGKKIFYPIYTEEEMRQDPEKRNTGLFFFRGKVDEPFAIVNAGGGFQYVGAIHESFPHCMEIARRGYNAFALIYRPNAYEACEDLARAIAVIFDHHEQLQVSTMCYSLWGGSAGARMAAWLGSYGTKEFGEKPYPKAGTIVMQYTGLSEWTRNDPPTFVIVGDHDYIADWRIMKRRIDHLKQAGIDTSFRVVSGLEHGFGIGMGTKAQGWIDEAIDFWQEQMKKEK